MQFPRFSIVIPSARPWSAVQKTLKSLQHQHYPLQKFEVLVVRNNVGIAQRHKAMSFSFKLRVFEGNQSGPAAARNFGIQQARHDRILFLDDDCVVSPDFLATYAAAWAEFPEAAIIGGPVHAHIGNATAVMRSLIEQHPWCFAHIDWGTQSKWLQFDETLMSANLSFDRRSIPRALDGNYFYTQLGKRIAPSVLVGGEDWELCLRVHRAGGQIAYVAQAIVDNQVAKDRFSFWYLCQRYWMAGKERALVEQHLTALFPHRPLQSFWKESLFSWHGGAFRLIQLVSYGLSRAQAVLYNPPWV